MEIDMERDLKDILAEVLVFPYEQSVVDLLTDACSTYVKTIDIEQFEKCVLHLCLDTPASELIESITTQTNRKFPNRVYRALAGYVVGEVLDNDSDVDDNVVFLLALRNVLKAYKSDASGIICKTIDPTSFAAVENYWENKALISSLDDSDLLSSEVFEKSTWAETGFDVEENFSDLQTLAKFYYREQFNKAFVERKPSADQDIYAFAYQIAKELAEQEWLFTAEQPVDTLKRMELKGTAISLSNIKLKIRENGEAVNDDIESTSVFRRYIYADDYEELGSNRINPLNFAIAIFYELLYERLKSEKYE